MKQTSKIYASGFTLLEVMITCTLGVILCGIIMQNYLSNKNIYNLNNKIARLNDNLQFADFFLRQAIIHAGFAGCRNITELNIHNHTNMHFDFIRPIKSYINNNSDILVITKANTAITNINQNVTIGANSIKVTKNPATEGNTLLLLSDCQNADLFTAYNYAKNQTIDLHNILNHNYKNKSATISRFEEMTFFIAKTTRLNTKNKPIYSLYLSINHRYKQELIPEIINMQVNYEINNDSMHNLNTQQMNNSNLWAQITALTIILAPQEQLLGIKEWKIYIKLCQKN